MGPAVLVVVKILDYLIHGQYIMHVSILKNCA